MLEAGTFGAAAAGTAARASAAAAAAPAIRLPRLGEVIFAVAGATADTLLCPLGPYLARRIFREFFSWIRYTTLR